MPQRWILWWHRVGFRYLTKERFHFACGHKGNQDSAHTINASEVAGSVCLIYSSSACFLRAFCFLNQRKKSSLVL